MQRYFVNTKENDTVLITDSDAHHIKNVMRFKVGEVIEVVYNSKLYLASIEGISKDCVKCIIQKEVEIESKNDMQITVASSLIKEQRFDLILEKATEIGVFQFVPVIFEHTNIKFDKNSFGKKIIRWGKIIKEAAEQSKRINLPKIAEITKINDIIKLDYDIKLYCSLSEKRKKIKDLNLSFNQKILLVVGPEGGLTESEEQMLEENNFIPISLGSNVLRTETAVIYALSNIVEQVRGD